jgi:hypothetical protein
VNARVTFIKVTLCLLLYLSPAVGQCDASGTWIGKTPLPDGSVVPMTFTLQDATVAFVYTGTVTLQLPSGSVTATIGIANNQFPPGLFLNADFSTLGFSLDFRYGNNTSDCNHVSDGNIYFDTTTLGPDPGTWTACRASQIDCACQLHVDKSSPTWTVVPSRCSSGDLESDVCTTSTSARACAVPHVPSTLNMNISCVDTNNNPVDSTFQLSVTAEPGGAGDPAGHQHGDPDRPSGSLGLGFQNITYSNTQISGSTTNGLLTVTYTAPEVSGVVDLTVGGTTSTGNTISNQTFKVMVKSGNLQPLPPSTNGYYLLLPSFGHGSLDGYASSKTITDLQNAILKYNFLAHSGVGLDFPPQVNISSIGLPWGGMFDICSQAVSSCTAIDNPWGPPHCGHRSGTSSEAVDLVISSTLVPPIYRPLLQWALSTKFKTPYKPESFTATNPTHWHLVHK